MHKLSIDLSDLELAFEDHSYLITYYLDKETGAIVFVTDDTHRELQEIYESYRDDQTHSVDWETVFQEERIADWHQEELLDAHRVEQSLGSRFIEIPRLPSHEGFGDMEEFIYTVRDLRLQQRLGFALRDRHPFRNFKMALDYYPAERQRWFKFKNDRMRERALDWLKSEEIELDKGE
jgi:hypothetical protein